MSVCGACEGTRRIAEFFAVEKEDRGKISSERVISGTAFTGSRNCTNGAAKKP